MGKLELEGEKLTLGLEPRTSTNTTATGELFARRKNCHDYEKEKDLILK